MRIAMTAASFAATLPRRKRVVYRLRAVDCNAGARWWSHSGRERGKGGAAGHSGSFS